MQTFAVFRLLRHRFVTNYPIEVDIVTSVLTTDDIATNCPIKDGIVTNYLIADDIATNYPIKVYNVTNNQIACRYVNEIYRS